MKYFILVAFLTPCLYLNAQSGGGTVNFANNNSCKVINGGTGNPVTTNDGIRAALYWAPPGSNTLSQIGATLTNIGAPLAGLYERGTRTTGAATPGGATAQFQVRAWAGAFATYALAVDNGG